MLRSYGSVSRRLAHQSDGLQVTSVTRKELRPISPNTHSAFSRTFQDPSPCWGCPEKTVPCPQPQAKPLSSHDALQRG